VQARVLIADDSPAVRRTLRHLLQADNAWEIVDADNGKTAVARALEFRPDVIILDLAMPVMDGLSAAREISKALPEAAILMYTMHWTPHLEQEAQKCGVRQLVSKSQGAILLSAVHDILAAKKDVGQKGAGMSLDAAASAPNVDSALPQSKPAEISFSDPGPNVAITDPAAPGAATTPKDSSTKN
jgi:DNA-binding NarL/FixJ family response regulator